MKPFEFLVPERPVSQQTRRHDRLREWVDFVAHHARIAATYPRTLAAEPVAITVVYLYEEAALDADNIVKPIQDALVGIVFDDDAIITDVTVRRRWLGSSFSLEGLSSVLASGFDLGREFVYVLLTDAPAQDVLL